jgi:hypothetical protein
MPAISFDALGIVRHWLDEPQRAAALAALTYAPGPSRLAKHCLAPLVHELVSPVPLATVEPRTLLLLDAAEDALLADLSRANDDVEEILAGIQQEIPAIAVRDLLTASDIQDRVAITLRGLLAPAWRTWTGPDGEPCAPFRGVWAAPQELGSSLHETAWLRRCKAWATAASAGDELSFVRRWRDEVRVAVVAADPAGHSPSGVSLGLGDLAVPRLADDPAQPYEWRLATDRSFYTRVQMYWDGKHLPRDLTGADATAEPPEDRFAGEPAPGEALVRESIRRTVSPLGLFLDEHRLLLEVVLLAVRDAAVSPRHVAGPSRLPGLWTSVLAVEAVPQHLASAIEDHASRRLAREGVAAGSLDEAVYARCVARRVWIRLHAWELVCSRIPASALVRDLNIALDQSLGAAGVLRAGPTRVAIDHRTTENTLRIVEEIIHELGDGTPPPDPASVLALYRKRYQTLRHDPVMQRNGGIHPPRWLQRKIEFRGEDL